MSTVIIRISNSDNTKSFRRAFKIDKHDFEDLKSQSSRIFDVSIEKFGRLDDRTEIDDGDAFDFLIKKHAKEAKNEFHLVALKNDEDMTNELIHNFKQRESTKISNVLDKLKFAESIDVCFLVDCTGSMDPYIEEVKNIIKNASDQLRNAFKDLKLRLAFIAYRDYDDNGNEPDDLPRIEVLPFTSDENDFRKFVGDVQAGGGFDACEDVFGGLEQVAKLEWRNKSRVLFHICDAPCHGKQFHNNALDYHQNGDPKGLKIDNLLKDIVALEIDYYFTEIKKEKTSKMIDEFDKAFDLVGGKAISVYELGKASDLLGTLVVSLTFTVTNAQLKAVQDDTPKIMKDIRVDKKLLNWDNANFEKHNATCYTFRFIGNSHVFKILAQPSYSDETIFQYIKEEQTTVQLQLCPVPFNRGSLRFAYAAKINNEKLVAKNSLFKDDESDSFEGNKKTIVTQIIAKYLADQFLKINPAEKSVRFIDIKLVKINKTGEYFTIEEFIDNSFSKWNNNLGFVNKIDYTATLNTFAHWTYIESHKYLIVTDLQGFRNGTQYVLTDPSISSTTRQFGATDLGKDGIKLYSQKHQCNHICEELKLEKLEEQILDDIPFNDKMTKLKKSKK